MSEAPFLPMEAKLVAALPKGTAWCYEPKWDGFRCLAERRGSEVLLWSKSGKPLGRYFPEMVRLLETLKAKRFLLDGELVIETEQGLSFEELQLRLHPAASRVQKLATAHPATYVVFDLLGDAKGKDWRAAPFAQRRMALEKFVAAHAKDRAQLLLSKQTDSLTEAQRWPHELRGLDGIIAKPLDAVYQSGERVMQKYKFIRTADCVVGGFRYGTGSKLVGSLLLGLYDDEGLLHHVGFTSAIAASEKKALTHKLEQWQGEGFTGNAPGGPSRWSTERSAQWVKLRPELVVEVSFDHVSDGRFRHGTKLLRWRPDKAPRQCTMEQLYQPPLILG